MTTSKNKKFNPDRDVSPWTGKYRPYDLVKEVTACFVGVAVLTLALALLFSSPDDKAVTLKQWAAVSPTDFAATAVTELDGSSVSAGYGPPYNSPQGNNQSIGPISPSKIVGVHIPVNPAEDFVIAPLRTQFDQPVLQRAVTTYTNASATTQARWTTAFTNATASATTLADLKKAAADPSVGPVGTMVVGLTNMARSGALETSMLTGQRFYGSDYTKPALFLADGGYFASLGAAQNLSGSQWGMMNETGNYPGQAWLWLYTMWYQVPPFKTSPNADLQIWALMMLLTIGLALVPFIPGIRSIPRWTRIYRLVWKEHYRTT